MDRDPNRPVREILDEPDDSQLCGDISIRIDRLMDTGIVLNRSMELISNNPMDVRNLSEQQRVVQLVYNALGIILNGGFENLFSADFVGDPGYTFTAAAYQKVGCKPATDAFSKALALFPSNTPLPHPKERGEFYESTDKKRRTAINCQFWDAQDAILAALAAYILANRDHFLETLK